MAVEITRTELTARELRAAALKTDDAKAARRMLALAMVLQGVDRKSAAESCGMDRQTLRDWVHRFNAEGLEGLSNRRSAGPSPRLSPEQKAELARMVREGPDPATDGVVRWRRVDLKRRIEAALRRRDARAHRRQTIGINGLSQALGPSAASEVRP